MSKVILLVCIGFFATTNAYLPYGVVRTVQSICNDVTQQRINVEKGLIAEKYNSLTIFRGMVANYQQWALDNLLNPASRDVDNAIKAVRHQIARLNNTRNSQCLGKAGYILKLFSTIRYNIDVCERNARSDDGDRMLRINEVKNRAFERLNSLESALNASTCVESWLVRWVAFEQLLISSAELDRTLTEINTELLRRINYELPRCIGGNGYDDFKRNARARYDEIVGCIDNELGGSVSSGKVG